MIKYSFIVKNQQFLTTYKHQYNHNTLINIHITLDHSTHSTSKHKLHHHSTPTLQIILYNKNPSKKKEIKEKKEESKIFTQSIQEHRDHIRRKLVSRSIPPPPPFRKSLFPYIIHEFSIRAASLVAFEAEPRYWQRISRSWFRLSPIIDDFMPNTNTVRYRWSRSSSPWIILPGYLAWAHPLHECCATSKQYGRFSR